MVPALVHATRRGERCGVNRFGDEVSVLVERRRSRFCVRPPGSSRCAALDRAACHSPRTTVGHVCSTASARTIHAARDLTARGGWRRWPRGHRSSRNGKSHRDGDAGGRRAGNGSCNRSCRLLTHALFHYHAHGASRWHVHNHRRFRSAARYDRRHVGVRCARGGSPATVTKGETTNVAVDYAFAYGRGALWLTSPANAATVGFGVDQLRVQGTVPPWAIGTAALVQRITPDLGQDALWSMGRVAFDPWIVLAPAP